MQNRNFVFLAVAVSAIILTSVMFFSEQNNNLSKQIIDECKLDVDCGINSLLEISKTEDEKTVLDVFENLKSYYQEKIILCHSHAHHLGMFLYDYIGDHEQAISIADAECGGALYHGIIQSYLSQFENPDPIDMTSICEKSPSQLNRVNFECYHGLGHALYSLYDSNIFLATDRCNDFALDYEIERCSAGVFMQNLLTQSKLNLVDFKEDDLHYPCNSVSQEFVRTCYKHQGYYIVFQNNNSATQSFETCNDVSNENKKYCYYGIGGAISAKNLDDINRILELCKFGDEEYQPECVNAAAKSISENIDFQHGFEFCKISPDYTKDACYDALGKWLKLFYTSEQEIEKQCSQSENSKYSEICLSASLDEIY